MNIFILHKNPKKCAQMHCDKHVVKMILETAQILSTVIQKVDEKRYDILYKPTHKNHPCVKWCMESIKNFDWLLKLGNELLTEYYHRYGKYHKSGDILLYCEILKPQLPFTFFKTPFVQAMPEKYKNPNPIKAYRSYYNGEKLHFCKWTCREVPKWIDKKRLKKCVNKT